MNFRFAIHGKNRATSEGACRGEAGGTGRRAARPFSRRGRQILAGAVTLLLAGGCGGGKSTTISPAPAADRAKYLYIWAGDQDRVSPDFVSVIDFDESSNSYGKVLKTAPVPTSGNEAHHMHLSADGKTLACGGLLSLLKGQDGIFFFDVTTPDDPKYLKSVATPLSGITDDFYPLPEGGFLVTQMGSNTGDAPGRVAEFNSSLDLVGEWPQNPPADGFNPHGLSARPEANLMVTSDFLNPITTLEGHGPPVVRGSLRVWDMAARTIVRTIPIPTAQGTMDVKLIPGDTQFRAFTAGMFDGLIYLVNTQTGESKPVFDTATLSRGVKGMPQVLAITDDGTRLIFPLLDTGQLVMLDVADPERPFVLSVIEFGPEAQPHDIDLTEEGDRLIVTDYFLNEDGAGTIHFEGDHKVHILKVTREKLELDPRFRLDFNTAFPTGPARPHGIASK